jgi:uncharacterized membrane protein (UPF0127 family)
MSMTGYVCFDNSCVEVELAMTQEEMATGLMNRTNLPEYNGMLFIFDKEYIRKFWMKNVIIPLDIIWLDERGIIVHIDKNMMPCDEYCKSFGPELSAKFVLEVNGLYTDRHNINVGDSVKMIF